VICGDADNFPDKTDADAVGFTDDSKADDLEFFSMKAFLRLRKRVSSALFSSVDDFAGRRMTTGFGARVAVVSRLGGAFMTNDPSW